MTASNQPKCPQQRRSGFSLVEIAVVVAVIGVLVALAIPAYKRSQDSTKIAALENDFRIYAQEFETFELKHQRFPDSQPVAGEFPPDMEGTMPENWKLPSPIGGTYRWVYTQEDKLSERSAYIEILNSSAHPIRINPDRLREIDEDLDDGNTATGNLVLSGLNLRYYIRR